MAQSATLADLIVETITHRPGCSLDEVVAVCPTLTWNQIFLEVDRLSRAGLLRLMLTGPGRYVVELPTDRLSCAQRSQDDPVPLAAPEWHPQDTRCERCGGLMVAEIYEDFSGRRCILCGERIDPVILAQRRKSESAYLGTMHAGC
ncbi:MAG: hypothetical protein IT391_16360 [Nitrospira sp.]|nr:hypothetical protein [Nitrospira sp.]